MARNSRKNGLKKPYKECIDVNNIPVLKSLLYRWTPLAKECYKRGCNCLGCDLVPHLDSLTQCRIKYYVMGYIKEGIYPKEQGKGSE